MFTLRACVCACACYLTTVIYIICLKYSVTMHLIIQIFVLMEVELSYEPFPMSICWSVTWHSERQSGSQSVRLHAVSERKVATNRDAIHPKKGWWTLHATWSNCSLLIVVRLIVLYTTIINVILLKLWMMMYMMMMMMNMIKALVEWM